MKTITSDSFLANLRAGLLKQTFTGRIIARQFMTCCVVVFSLLAIYQPAIAQDGFTGDGFGGRSWYKPANMDAGLRASAAILNGQLYMWGYKGGSNAPYTIAPLIKPYTLVDYTGVTTGTNADQYALPQAVPGFANTRLVSIDGQAGAIKTDGSGWVWGPTLASGVVPSAFGDVPIQVIASGAYHVNAGLAHVAFVKTDGTVWSAGWNRYGNFGNGTVDATQSYTTAVQMTGITNAVRVAAFGSAYDPGAEPVKNYAATLVLKRDGTVWVAGGNNVLTTSGASNLPVQVPGLSNAVDIKAGYNFAVALTSTGDCYAWGSRYEGSLGNGETQNTAGIYTTPQKVLFPAGTPPIVAIETESSSGITYAIDETGTLWAWGAGSSSDMLGVLDSHNAQIPIVSARHVADVTMNAPTVAYMTRTSEYPTDQRLWFISATASKIFALSPKEIINTSIQAQNYALNVGGNSKLWAVSRPEDVGLIGVGGIASPTTIAGTVDCAATALVGSLVAGTPSNVMLKVTATVSTTGTGSLTVSGSGLSPSPSPGTFTATTTGTQTFYIPMAYSGTALGATTFTFSGLGACSADLSGLTQRPVKTVITLLVNCTPITPGTLSK